MALILHSGQGAPVSGANALVGRDVLLDANRRVRVAPVGQVDASELLIGHGGELVLAHLVGLSGVGVVGLEESNLLSIDAIAVFVFCRRVKLLVLLLPRLVAHPGSQMTRVVVEVDDAGCQQGNSCY